MTLFRPFGIIVRGNNSNEFFAIGLHPTLTPFLRFDNVTFCINSWSASKSIGGDISSLGNAFNAFKTSKLIVDAVIDQNDPSHFPNHKEMLDYIANQVFPTSIFHSSQSCKFVVTFFTDSENAKDFVSSLLQLPAISRKPNILIKLRLYELDPQQLRTFPMPTEGIAKWLHHSEGTGKERVLCIDLGDKIENPREIFNHLKEVNFLCKFLFFCSFHFYLLKFKDFFSNLKLHKFQRDHLFLSLIGVNMDYLIILKRFIIIRPKKNYQFSKMGSK